MSLLAVNSLYFAGRLSRPIVLVVAALSVAGVRAETENVAFLDSIVSLNEVSVSAIKSTSAHSFPSSATVVGSREIKDYDLTDLKDVSEIAPNFYIPSYGSRMTSSIYVRGLGTRIDQPVVALNIDNVPILNKDAYDFSMPDLERIEMVRGAQSILYGRNTMGGVVNISTLSPLRYTGVRGLVEYGSANSWRAAVAAYSRPSETFGIGIVGAYNSTDGFFRNDFTGNKVDKERQGLGKLKLSWRPSARFVIENTAWATVTRQGGYPYESVETHSINHNDTCFYRRTSVFDGITARWSGRNISVSSITGFHYINDNMTLDQDFLPEDYFTLTQKRHEYSISQDFVVKGGAGAYKYLTGAFGFYKRSDMSAPVTFKDYGIEHLIEDNINQLLPDGMALRWDERSMLLASDFLLPSWGWAVYHKSEYAVNGWTFAAGLRLAFERASIDYSSAVSTSATMYMQRGSAVVPVGQRAIDVSLSDRLHMTSLQLLPEIKVAYDFSPALSVGAVFSKGYKSGGYNTQMFSDILQQTMMSQSGVGTTYNVDDVIAYKPEESWNYEINFASSMMDGVLCLDATLFYIDCRNQQMTMFPEGSTTGRIMANAGRTRSLGGELAVTWNPVRQWNVNVAYGLADARFRRFDNGLVDCKGNHVPYAPENTLFAAVTYSRPITAGPVKGIEATVGCRGVGNIYWDEENTVRQPFYALLSLSATIRTGLCDIDLWGKNLTSTRYSTFYFESIGNRFVQRGQPRSFGVTLRFAIQ